MSSDNQSIEEFIVRDFTHANGQEQAPLTMFVPAKDIYDVLTDAKQNNKKITVHEIGRCIINWK
jgi:hypothetical protein